MKVRIVAVEKASILALKIVHIFSNLSNAYSTCFGIDIAKYFDQFAESVLCIIFLVRLRVIVVSLRTRELISW